MTKYICECLDGARKCTHETPGFLAPTLCCVRANATCNWRAVEDQKPEHPDWIKAGAWCYIHSGGIGTGKYQKIQSVHSGFVQTEYLVPIVNISEARLRPWNDDELKSKVGKVFEDDVKNPTLCFRYQRDNKTLHFAGKIMSAESLAESDWKLDGSPCGVFEHYEQGEWVK